MTHSEDVTDRLTARLRRQTGTDVRVEGLESVGIRPLAELLAFTVVTARTGSCREVVLRMRPPPPALLEPYDLDRQFRILAALDGCDPRRPFFVMDRVEGAVYELEALEATRERVAHMCRSMIAQLAAVHSVNTTAVGLADLADGAAHLQREPDHWTGEMRRVQAAPLPALERLHTELESAKPRPCARVTLVHGDAKPGNFAFIGDEASAVFDWEMTTLGDPLTDLGWLELLWMQPVGIASHPNALTLDELLEHYTTVRGIAPQHRRWYRALAAYKMAVICLIGSMLYASGESTDERYALNAYGIPMLTKLGLAELGVTEPIDDGPVLAR